MKRVIICFYLFSLLTVLLAQDRPRLAVLPLNASGVSKFEANVFTSLLETGLVKTVSFTVIEQNQMADILETQSVSLTGCTDETCAIEMGKLLAAEQIILGEISQLGSKYIANAKIVDITQGKNLRAETVNADSLEELMEQMEVLAFLLAGLVVPDSSDSVTLASESGEIFVQTEPVGADIYLNGAKKGTAPLMISRIPAGNNTVEARKDNFYAVQEVRVIPGALKEVELSLRIMKGNIFLKNSDPDGEVFFDGESLGALGNGLFKGLPVGVHTIEVRSEDKVWRTEVELLPGKSVSFQVLLKEYGNLQLDLPDFIDADLAGKDYSAEALTGNVNFEMFYTGSYTLTIPDNKYSKAYSGKIIVKQGDNYFKPELEYTELWFTEVENRRRLEKIAAINREIIEIETEMSDLMLRIEKKRHNNRIKYISGAVLSTVSAGLGAVGYYYLKQYESAYQDFSQSFGSGNAASDIAKHNHYYEMGNNANLSINSSIAAAVGSLFCFIFPFFENSNIREYEKEIIILEQAAAQKELERETLDK